MFLVLSILLAFVVFLRGQASEPNGLEESYYNPILPGFHPDPSCQLVEEFDNTYFCVTSSFNAFPGVPVMASKDLIHFKQIGNSNQFTVFSIRFVKSLYLQGNVINRPDQLPDFNQLNGPTSGIWAATIR